MKTLGTVRLLGRDYRVLHADPRRDVYTIDRRFSRPVVVTGLLMYAGKFRRPS